MKFNAQILVVMFSFAVLSSCEKEEPTPENTCDLHDYTGSWSFIVNGDPSTEFIGQIDKFNDGTLNVHYQPSTEYDNFLQTDLSCNDGLIFKQLPAGNHGTKTIEGSITLTNFVYQDSTYINYTGTPQITVKTIVGTKL